MTLLLSSFIHIYGLVMTSMLVSRVIFLFSQAVVTTDSGDRGGGGWFTSVGNFLAKSFYW